MSESSNRIVAIGSSKNSNALYKERVASWTSSGSEEVIVDALTTRREVTMSCLHRLFSEKYRSG